MVVQGILALALALPTGLLFGVGYGTGVRIGYEQVYPLLFPTKGTDRNVTPTVNNIKQINGIYNAIGGKEASQMGIAMGLQGAMEEIDRNPDFQALEALELRLSGRTQQRLGMEIPSKETSISDFPLGSSLDPNSPNFNPEYYILVNKQKQAQDFPPNFDFGNKEELNTYRPTVAVGGELAPTSTKNVQERIAYTKFITETMDWSNGIRDNQSVNQQALSQSARNRLNDSTRNLKKLLRQASNRYRDPNNAIRKDALRLRQNIANGRWHIR